MPPLILVFSLLTGPAAAFELPSCTTPSEDGEVPTLDAVRTCQERVRGRVFQEYTRNTKKEPSAWLREKVDTKQREEIRLFLQKHPGRASFSHAEREAGKPQQRQAEGIVDTLTAYFGKAKGKVVEMLGLGEQKKRRKSNATAAELEAARSLKAVTDAAKESGLDLKKHKTGSLLNPGKTLSDRAKKYNESLDKNLDPSMKKFYKKGKKKR
jgi:hypothetical protein